MPYKDPQDPRKRESDRLKSARYRQTEHGRAMIQAYKESGRDAEVKAVSRFMRLYGLDKQQAEVALVSGQGDFCASCGDFAKLVVDHNHNTGAPRGMVCQRCNQIAGALEDQKLDTVQAYLSR